MSSRGQMPPEPRPFRARPAGRTGKLKLNAALTGVELLKLRVAVGPVDVLPPEVEPLDLPQPRGAVLVQRPPLVLPLLRVEPPAQGGRLLVGPGAVDAAVLAQLGQAVGPVPREVAPAGEAGDVLGLDGLRVVVEVSLVHLRVMGLGDLAVGGPMVEFRRWGGSTSTGTGLAVGVVARDVEAGGRDEGLRVREGGEERVDRRRRGVVVNSLHFDSLHLEDLKYADVCEETNEPTMNTRGRACQRVDEL